MSPQPHLRVRLLSGLAPFCATLVTAALLLPDLGHLGRTQVVVALVVQLVVGAVVLAGPRLTERSRIAVPTVLAYLVAVGLVRDTAGPMSGVGLLALLPVVWFALQARRTELLATIGGALAVIALPWVAGFDDNAGTAPRTLLLMALLASSLAYSISSLVGRVRREAGASAAILGAMSEGLLVTSDSKIVVVNDALCAMTGIREEDLLGSGPPYPFWPRTDVDELERLRRHVVEAGGGEWELTLERPDGSSFVAAMTATRADLGDGRRTYLTTVRDITVRREQDVAMRHHVDQLDAIATVTRAVGHSDPSDARRAVCETALGICAGAGAVTIWEFDDTGRARNTSAVPDVSLRYVIGPDQAEHGVHIVRRSREPLFVADAVSSPHCDQRIISALGAASVHFQPIADADGVRGVLVINWPERRSAVPEGLGTLIGVLADEAAIALQRADLLDRLDHLTRTDELTGLPNRRAWDEILDAHLGASLDVTEPVTVAMLDLDHFKAYNDENGHLAGDRLLRVAAAAWRHHIRESDVLARWGGEEFALMLPGCNIAHASSLINRLRGLLPGGMTFSAGVAEWDGSMSGRELLGAADSALYDAKADGRDRIVVA